MTQHMKRYGSTAGPNLEGKLVLAGSAFALGLVTGLILRRAATQADERARLSRSHADYERTVTYDENLPDTLGRREPAPHPGQPRFGGTGAIGVSPASVSTPRTDE
jgi:hypothetical protein